VELAFFPLRFQFAAQESLYFPPGKASNVLRGALGTIFRKIACVSHCPGARECPIRTSCPYALAFEPASPNQGPSGLADSPRPFVFRARQLDGRSIRPGGAFSFDLHLFSREPDILAYFILTFGALAREGLGPRRGKAELQRVTTVALDGEAVQTVYEKSSQAIAAVRPASVDLSPSKSAPSRIRVEFLSPTELKHEHKVAARPEFPILFGRIRDRISTLRRLYGPGPLDIDFQATNERAAAIRMTDCQMHRQQCERRSTRTGQSHTIGGFVGTAEYEGDLAEFLPYLEAARWTGVGRQVVWGKGEIGVVCK
jgi:hypothetical protein